MAIKATVTLIDSLNTTVTKSYECEATVLATAQSDMVTLLAALEAVSDLGVVSVTYSLKDTSQESECTAGSSVDGGATFRMRLDNGKVAAHKVPGFPISKVSSDRNIPVSDEDVVAYFDNFKTAGAFTVNEGNVMDALLSGKYDV